MILIKNIGDSFDDLGYSDLNELENCLINLDLINFSKLISWLANNLNQTSEIESTVNEIKNDEDISLFKIELSGLLKELSSPYTIEQLDDTNNKLKILNYLCGEVLASSMKFCRKSNESEFNESEIAKQLRLIMMILGVSKPPADVTIKQIFDKIIECIDNEFKKRNIIIEDSILFKNFRQTQLPPKLLLKLDECNELLKQEYEMRKRTLITRSDCTVASFKWSKRDINNVSKAELEKQINDFYIKFNYLLERNIEIDISDILALKPADFNQLNNVVISKSHEVCAILPLENNQLANQGKQQKLSLHKFIIQGRIPDRGGRCQDPNETNIVIPQKETFQQQQQQREQQQQRQNRQNFSQNRQNFNLNLNRVQGSGWNQNYQQDKFNNNRNYQQGNFSRNQNTQYSNNQYNQQDQYYGGQRNNRGGGSNNYNNQQDQYYGGGQRNNRGGGGNNRGRGGSRFN